MSYEALAQALIEDQEQILGEQAYEGARGVSGIRLDGTEVVNVTGQDAVAALVDYYEDQMGQAALTSLQIAASDFEDEVSLPSQLRM